MGRMPSPIDALDLPFMRTALAELLLLGVAGGLLGSWIVLRGLAFFTHAVGTATFPGLVIADAAGLTPHLAGAAVALGYTGGVERATRSGRQPADAATGLLLVAALAIGVVLASDVFESGAGVDRLLFGTLIGLDGADVAVSAGAAALALAGTAALGRAWLASGFDPAGTRALGLAAGRTDALLLAVVALAVVAALPAVGALLVTAIFIVPAATVRLVSGTLHGLLAGAVALALAEGALGLYLAYWIDVSPGPAVAALGAAVYIAVALATAVRR
jgi:manganese/iron transport system permease protein